MDNKYANLPGIAKNEPDFYETPNTASSFNSKVDSNEDDSSNTHHINLKDAHDKYNKGSLNNDYADFSDTITNRRKFGYIVEPDTYEWNQDIAQTPLFRYKRLEQELAELKKDLINMEKFASEEDKHTLINFNPVDLSKQVESLQKEINSLHLQKIGAKVDLSKLDNKTRKQLMTDHLNDFKKILKANKKEGDVTTDSTQSNAISFKLFADLEEIDLEKANKVTELNSRLANLEKVFGAGNGSVNDSQIAKLCTNIENKSILGLVENLNSKLSLLDMQSLEQVESKLQIVSQRINQLNEKKSLVEDQEKMARINELYTIVNNWKDVSASVPAIVERLSALNDIHQKAFQFTSTLTRMDKEQQNIIKSLETGNDVLINLKNNFESNLESIKTNFDALNERIMKINPK